MNGCKYAASYELIVIGAGPAGLAAACAAWEKGIQKILLLERDKELGGILNQCIHNGFGLHYFKEELTGPEYAGRFIKMLEATGVTVQCDSMVLQITKDKTVHAVSKAEGYRIYQAKAIILAMGCRERTRGAIAIPGTRPAGVMTAGAAQKYVNINGYMVGRRIVILGSGDIGLIMARRMTLEGANVLACVEVLPYSGGLNRNLVQCLQDYHIPLYLSHTITNIKGQKRVSEVEIAKVDAERRPIEGTRFSLACDTVLLSVGLIPENELTKQAGIQLDSATSGVLVYDNMETSATGIFACGNVVHVHDIVDFVTAESQRAGRAAADFIRGKKEDGDVLEVHAGNAVSYTVPQKIRKNENKKFVEIFFRVKKVMSKAEIGVYTGERLIKTYPRDHMAPGEMAKLALPMADLCGEIGPVVISVMGK